MFGRTVPSQPSGDVYIGERHAEREFIEQHVSFQVHALLISIEFFPDLLVRVIGKDHDLAVVFGQCLGI